MRVSIKFKSDVHKFAGLFNSCLKYTVYPYIVICNPSLIVMLFNNILCCQLNSSFFKPMNSFEIYRSNLYEYCI